MSFTAGLLTAAAVYDTITEVHGSDDSHCSVLSFTDGFVVLVFVSAGLGQTIALTEVARPLVRFRIGTMFSEKRSRLTGANYGKSVD